MKQNNRLFMTFFLLAAFLLLLFATSGVAAFPQQELYDEKDDTPLYPGDEEMESEAQSSPETENEKGGPGDTEDRDRGDSEADRDEEKAVFSYCITPPEISLDPIHTFTSTEAQVYTALFEGLVSYHPFTLGPLPGIAKRGEISRDR